MSLPKLLLCFKTSPLTFNFKDLRQIINLNFTKLLKSWNYHNWHWSPNLYLFMHMSSMLRTGAERFKPSCLKSCEAGRTLTELNPCPQPCSKSGWEKLWIAFVIPAAHSTWAALTTAFLIPNGMEFTNTLLLFRRAPDLWKGALGSSVLSWMRVSEPLIWSSGVETSWWGLLVGLLTPDLHPSEGAGKAVALCNVQHLGTHPSRGCTAHTAHPAACRSHVSPIFK